MAWSVYILKSLKVDWFYVGMSQEPEERLVKSHNRGKVKSTKARKPYKIVLTESFQTKREARLREKYYKTGFGKKVWMKKIREYNRPSPRPPQSIILYIISKFIVLGSALILISLCF